MSWNEYLQKIFDAEAEQRLEEIKKQGCSICGSHVFGWMPVLMDSTIQYYTCMNCIQVKESFTTA